MILVAIRIFSIVMEACKVVRQGIANEISVQTMRQAVNSATLKACVKKEKPLLSHKNIQAHFDLAKSHKNWTLVDWKQVVFHMRLRSIIFALTVIVLGSRRRGSYKSNSGENTTTWKKFNNGLELHECN